MIGYTVVIAAIMMVNILYVNDSVMDLALRTAEAEFRKDMQYRNWLIDVGGAYVAVSEHVKPNPHLSYSERDVTTPSGHVLTLMNPMYLIEQVFGTGRDSSERRARMVSLDTLRNVQRPDAWEREALQSFEQGAHRRFEVRTVNGREVLCFIAPVYGIPFAPAHDTLERTPMYRGGMSYMIPLSEIEVHQENDFWFDFVVLAVVWMAGVIGIYVFGRLMRREVYRRLEDMDRFRQVTEQSTDLIYILDRSGAVTRANAAFYHHLGRDAEKRDPIHFADFIPNPSAQDILQQLEPLFREPSRFESVHITAADELVPVEITTIPVSIEDQQYLYCTGRDITERKQREEKVKRSEQLFRQIWEQTGEGLRLTDANGIITKVNEAYCRMVERSREELEGKPLSVAFRTDRKDEIIRKHISNFAHHVIQSNEEKALELWNGEHRWVFVSNAYVLTEGHQLQLLGTFRDITERKRIEERIHKSDEQLRFVTQNSQDLIFRYEFLPIPRYLYVSPSVMAIAGYTPQELYADAEIADRMIHPDDRKKLGVALRQSDSDKITIELRWTKKDGQTIWTEQKLTISRDRDGRVLGLEGIARDISERVRIENELKSYNGLLTSMLENIPFDFWVRDAQGTMIIQSKTGREFWGDLRDKKIDDSIVDPEAHEHWKQNNERALGGEIVRAERAFILPVTGEHRTLFEVVAPYYIDGRTAGLLGINIDITEQREMNRQLSLQSAALNAAANAIVITDRNGSIEWVNPAFEEMTGYRVAEAIGKNPNALVKSGIHPEPFYKTMWDTITAGNAWTGEVVNRRKNGAMYVEEQTITPVIDDNGAIRHFIGIKQDITEKKKIERQIMRDELKFRSYMDAAPLGIFVKDRDGNYEEINPSGLHMFGYTKEEMRSATALSFVDPAYQNTAKEFFSAVLHNGYASEELLFRRKDGTAFWVRANAVRLSDGRVISYKEDISDRKRLTELLTQKTQTLQTLLDNAPVGMWMVDKNHRPMFVNKVYCDSIGISEDRFLTAQHYSDLYDERTAQICIASDAAALASPVAVVTQEQLLFTDGQMHDVEITKVRLQDTGGNISGLIGISRDITEKKLADQAVAQQRNELENIVGNLPGFIYRLSPLPEMKCLYISDAVELITGYTKDEYLGNNIVMHLGSVHPDDLGLCNETIRYAMQMKQKYEVEYRFRRKDGVQIWLWERGNPILDESGNVKYVEGYVSDISLSKTALEGLQQSEQRFRVVWDSTNEAMRLTDAEGTIVMVNEAYCTLVRLTREELIGAPISVVYPMVRAAHVMEQYRKNFGGRDVLEFFEQDITLKDGIVIFVQGSNAFLNLSGEDTLLLSVFRDITSRVHAEREVMLSEQRYRSLIETSLDGFWAVDMSGKILEVNDAYCRMSGYSREEILEMSIDALEVSDTPEVILQRIHAIQERGKLKFEAAHRTRSGQTVLMEISTVYHREWNEILAFFNNITEKRAAERALIEREIQYRSLISTMHQGMAFHEMIFDAAGVPVDYRFLDVNTSFEELTGLIASEIIGRTVTEILPDTEPYWIENYGMVVTSGVPSVFENYSEALGKYFEVVAYRPKRGHFATIITDITDRKRSEESVKANEKQYRLLAENSTDVIWTMTFEGKFTYISPSVFQLRGYTPEEVMQQTMEEVVCPASIPSVMEGLKKRISQAQSGESVMHEFYEVEQPCKNGTTVWTEVVTHIMRDDNGTPTGVIGVSRDITTRKRSEDLLRARLLLSEYATTHTVKELLQKILDEAERITESTIGFFHFVEDDQKTIALQTWSTNTLATMCQAEGDGKHYPIDKAGVWVECVHQRGPVVHNDFHAVPNKKGMPEGHAPIHRELLIPILRKEKVVGIMGVGNKLFNYDQRDIDIADQLATMSWDILERRRAELSLQRHEQALAGLSTAAVDLLHMNERNSEETIRSALAKLGIGLDADRVYIFQNSMDHDEVLYTSIIHEWTREDVSRELQNPKMQYIRLDQELPTFWKALSAGRTLNAFTEQLTEPEQQILREQHIQSIILVPINIDDQFWGFLGVDAVRSARRWSMDEDSVIRVAAESFGIAIQRITVVGRLFEREQMLKFALEASGDGVWNYTIPTGELYLSREAKALAGYQNDEFPNLFEAWMQKVHPDDRDEAQAAMERHLRGETPIFINEHRMQCKDGSYRWMLDRGKVLTWNRDGTPYQIFGTYSDIHHRKETEQKVTELNEQLEQKVTERTKQLRDSMQEMESFSYSISHDLRAPVRAIDSFTKILSDEEESRLSMEGKRLLNSVRSNTARMGRMIDDLLQFSRASRAEIKKVAFDMGPLIAKVAEEARAVEMNRAVRIVVHPLPPAFGDPSLLRQVAVNLIGNAVKFTRNRTEAEIEIGGAVTEAQITYWVKDNGTGFDMRYVDKLFGVFQRLHSQQEFEGTGVGLAIVHRILQKHGGSISVQSDPGIGTTFTFTIPAQQQ